MYTELTQNTESKLVDSRSKLEKCSKLLVLLTEHYTLFIIELKSSLIFFISILVKFKIGSYFMLTECFLNISSLSHWLLILLLHICLVMSPIKSYSNFSYNSNDNTTFSDQIKPPQGVVSLTS